MRMIRRRAANPAIRSISLRELVAAQKKAGFTLPEHVMLTNRRPLGTMVSWEPSDSPEQITVKLAPRLADKIRMIAMSTDMIRKVEETETEDGKEFTIWIDHHLLSQELGQRLTRRLLTGS